MGATTASTALAHEAYEATAPVYDAFTSHHRHELWTDMLERLLRPHGLADRGRLLDVGCGTGKSFLPWEARGWSVVACDTSPAMLARAAAKAGPRTETLVADARDLPRLGAFDLVAMTDDVVNYLAPDDHAAAFAAVGRNLAPAGLFVFDLNTLLSYRTFFAETDVRDEDDHFAVWRGRAAPDFPPGGVADAVLDAFVAGDDGRWERRRALHRQHHHPIDEVAARLRAAGLRVCAVHGADDDCVTGALDELRHGKAVVVATHAERR
jgi:SAM-dependent methyltransferase